MNDGQEFKIIANTKINNSVSLHQWNLGQTDGKYEECERVGVTCNKFVYSLVFPDDGGHPVIEVWTADDNDDPDHLLVAMQVLDKESDL